MLLYPISAFTQKNIKQSYKNYTFKIEEFKIPDGPYSVSDIQDYFVYIFKKMEKILIIL